jgi:hypothetical protein
VTVTPEFLQALPYVMTVVVLVLVSTAFARRRPRGSGGARAALRARRAVERGRGRPHPRSLDEALRLKSEHPARADPGREPTSWWRSTSIAAAGRVLNLNEVDELRGWALENGDAPTRSRADVHGGDGRSATTSGTRRGLAHGRLAADPQPRDDRRQPRHRVPAGDALPPLLIEGARSRSRASRRARHPARRVPRRRQAERARRGRADRGASRPTERQPQTFMKVGPRNAMVIAVTSLALVADRERSELRAAFGSAAPTPRLVRGAARRGGHVPRAGRRCGEPDRRRARHRRVPPPRSPRPHAARAREVSRVRIELTVNGSASRGRSSGQERACS